MKKEITLFHFACSLGTSLETIADLSAEILFVLGNHSHSLVVFFFIIAP